MIPAMSEVTKEILDFIRQRMELPENLIGVDIHIHMDSKIKIECSYFPKAKESELVQKS